MITFVGMPARSSGEIRGRQVAERMGGTARFADIHFFDWSSVADNRVVVFVRSYDKHLAHELRARGHSVGYDLLDQMVGHAVFNGSDVPDLSPYAHAQCDFFLVNNSLTKLDLEPFVAGRPIHVVPHHSPNYDGHVNPVRDPLDGLHVGYVGLPEQLSATDEIRALCEDRGHEFVSCHPATREECDALFRTLDVGVVFAESDSRMRPRVIELMKRYKPATKATNFMSYGIPCVAVPYASYEEFGTGWRRAETREEMLYELEHLLIEDAETRGELALEAAVGGRAFHVDRVVETYREIARSRV